jgi:hypothetical protein
MPTGVCHLWLPYRFGKKIAMIPPINLLKVASIIRWCLGGRLLIHLVLGGGMRLARFQFLVQRRANAEPIS